MSRKLPEWIATHDDQAIPLRVQLRIFEAYNKHCAVCTLPIVGKLKPAYDHIRALINGGEHRESNLQLLCVPCHAAKTKKDVAEKSRMYVKKIKAAGIKKKSSWGNFRKKMDGTIVKKTPR